MGTDRAVQRWQFSPPRARNSQHEGMSGEAGKRKGKGKGKGKKDVGVTNGHGTDTNGLSVPGRREKADEGGAGLCTKLVFGVLLASFALTATLYLTDYQQGQLAKLTASLPPEVQQLATKADQALADLTKNLQRIAANGVDKAEELAEKVPVGDKTLADYVFSSKRKENEAKAAAVKAAKEKAEKEAARLEAERKVAEEARLAAEKKAKEEAEKLAAEQLAKKIAEEKAEAERVANEKLKEEAKAKREAAEAAAIKKAEEELQEQLRKEAVAAELEAAHQKKQAEVQGKFEEAKKKLEESGAEFVSNEEFAKIKSEKYKVETGA